jgi:hypothetical protein
MTKASTELLKICLNFKMCDNFFKINVFRENRDISTLIKKSIRVFTEGLEQKRALVELFLPRANLSSTRRQINFPIISG